MIDPVAFLGEEILQATETGSIEFTFDEVEGQVYANAPSSGISLVLDGGSVEAVQLYGPARDEGFAGFPGLLPFGLDFDMSRSEARSVLGEPEASGEPRAKSLIGPVPGWDRFDVELVRIHLEFDAGEQSIGLVTLTTCPAP